MFVIFTKNSITSFNHEFLSRLDKTCIILLWLTPDDFTRQRGSSHRERASDNGNEMFVRRILQYKKLKHP